MTDNGHMLTRAQIAKKYGISERQVRYRLTQLDGLVDKHIVTDEGGHVALDNDGLAIFDRLMQLGADGLSLATAVSRLRSELENPQENGVNKTVNSCPGCTAKDELIEELREQNRWLRDRVEELEIKALPDSRPWWQRLLGIKAS